ncbi:MAG: sensor histidine kinase [Ruminococcus sp.]|jgi:signal transduction histidine kinase
MNIYVILALAVIINIIFLYFIIHWYRNKLLIQYRNFLKKTDEILSGKPIEISYDESLDSAISERLSRIMEISRMQKESAEEERDIVKSLITNISHQIRTPLANITLYTGLLKERINDSESIRLAGKIENNAEKLSFFMKELLKSSYAEQEIISVSPKNIDLGAVIKRSCQSVELDAMKKEIQLISEYHTCNIYADSKWTEEVFTNILENAIKYSHNRATVTIQSVLYESFVCVRVIDNGIGIPEEEQGKIFQRFYRGTNVTDKQGFGIGLYLSREVLRKQKGYIKVKSKLNKGTTVEIFLSREDF